MKSIATLALTIMIASALSFSKAHSATAFTKPHALKSLREWRGRVLAEDEALISSQKKQLGHLATVTLKRSTTDAHAPVDIPIIEIERLDGERIELEARRRIVDQIIFAIDTKWTGTDLKGFLGNQLLDLATNDLAEPGQGGWWKFLTLASISLRETAEKSADPVRFLEDYMNQSSVLEPKSALEIMKNRDYVGE